MITRCLMGALAGSVLLSGTAAYAQEPACQIELVVLGAGQDAGAPQIGNADDAGPRLLPSSLGLIDRESGARYLFDATPAITEQLAMLDAIEPPGEGLGIDGIFLTHAHIGHYLGLAYLGREAAGASGVPVYALPRMADFLRSNGPWSQLVEQENIAVEVMTADDFTPVSPAFSVLPSPVEHRDEFSETAAYVIYAGETVGLYLPDLDSWDALIAQSGEDGDLGNILLRYDYAFVDATFWDDNELLDENGVGRDMSEIPHPRVIETMDMLQHWPAENRARLHFIHYNHTNPIRDPDSAESREVTERGFNVARRGDRHCLDSAD